ncbi:MAG: redoxin domain-containing protein [Pacificimonas sp.]
MRNILIAAALIAAPALAAPQVGKAAPEFTAISASGETVKLSDYRGKTVVLEWTNKGCPYVAKHYKSGNMQSLQADAAKDGVVWLTVNSGAAGKQGHVDAKGANAEMAEYETTQTAYLLDLDGKVGKAYGASATPHMYVVDGKGVLRYMGAIDDKPTSKPEDVKGATNYVAAALDAVAAGEAPSPAATRAYGCSVKYAG